MESKNIIIVLIVIILILAVMIGITVLHPFDTKQASKVKITSNKTLTEGDNLTVKLTDLNKSPISKEKVNIIIKDSKGKVVANKTVQTNDKGNAKLDLDLKKGKYDVSARYDGNKNYTGNNTTQELTVKEKVIVAEPTSSSSYDPGAFYSRQSMKTFYTGDIVQQPGGGYARHLGNNRWEPL
ncbi:hypothetical protein [Methanobrevibacter sp.]|uniref:Ig-like domain repeat protein n=1 Tax=Methanobrevibacter sp. TaxID=66852 RepID=UPI002E790D30|nr:hypothetical protein [Methanobrevibacter sp.]MEE0940204.1 hypothetical protein [Methanobrevibacter sp.]